ncbi:MAG: DNA polymerase III subunit alpha [Myxococcota bacterium]
MSASDSGGFTHLHLHSQYSLLDGAIRLADLVPTVKEKGMTSVAVTDHGNMFGAIDFYKTAKKHGVKPIMGCEAYVAGSKGRHDRTDRTSAHMVLLAKDNEGYKNLSYLISMGFMEGFYYHPRIDLELLKKHSKGLYATSACLGGVINKTLWRDGESAAAAYAKELKEVFEPGHFFLELQSNGYEQQVTANTFLMNVAEMYDIPLVATADAHYLKPKDSAAHEILMCIKENKSLGEFRQKFKHSDELYVKSPEEMHQAFAKICPQAVENAAMIANNCNVELDLSTVYMPKFPIPEGFDLNTYLEHTALQGLDKRIAEARYPIDRAAYKARLDYELGVIIKMNFAGYFLVVWDFIRFAKESTIPVGPGRGSGAGSLVAFCLRITDLDPIPNDLLFERFLNPERKSMPDFDVDFCQDRRGEVINYVTKKYGEKNVGQIVTYAQLSAKGVIKDVARVMEVPFQEVNELTKLIPALVNGKKVTIDQALELEPKLRQIQDEKPVYKEIINVARALEGLNRNTGMHAAGVVIGDKPLWEYVPVLRGKEGEIITQFAKDEVELAGLIKFDFLGLKTLTVIANAVKHVRHVKPDFNAENLPLDDAKVYQLIAAADTDGVFQLESSGFKELLKRLKPDRFEDIVAAVALYRPGPLDAGMVDDYIARKHGKKKVEYPHPSCEEILKPTYGVIVYQEQVMRIAVALSGFTLGESDTLRKAMGKKKADVMAEMRAKFVNGAVDKSGMKKEAADELFTQIEKFAGYAFNKSHSAAYAVVTYQTAYLKTYFPVEFTAALLSTEMGVQDNVVRYISSAKQHGIKVMPPDVNASERDFTVVREADGTSRILFGLGAVKGIGDTAIEAIIEGRAGGKAYTSLFDLCERVSTRKMNRKVLEALAKSGAFDQFGKPREVLLGALDKAIELGSSVQKDRESGQTNLFAAFAMTAGPAVKMTTSESYPSVPEWTEKQKLVAEKEALGFFVTSHPLDSYADDLPRIATTTTMALPSLAESRDVRFGGKGISIAGIITQFRERPLKSGDGRMAFVTIEDLTGSCEVLVFSKVYAEYEQLLKGDDPVLVTGAVMVDHGGGKDADETEAGGAVKLRAQSVELLSDARAKKTKRLELAIPVYAMTDDKLVRLRELLVQNRGDVQARLTITQPNLFETVIVLPETMKVNPTEELLIRVDKLFGQKVVKLA